MAKADERFQEAMEVLIKGWTARQPFDHRGTYWTFNDMTVHPRPVQSPHPPVWVAATSPGSMDRVAQQHWNLLIGQGEPLQQVADQLAYFKRAVMDAGDAYDPGRVKVARAMYTAPTAEQARQDAAGPFTWFRKTSHAVGAPPGRRTALLPDNYERYRQRFAAEAAFDYDDMQDRVILFGSPDHVAERVDRLRQSGADQLILFVNYGGIDSKKVMNSLELFASKVMPQFAD